MTSKHSVVQQVAIHEVLGRLCTLYSIMSLCSMCAATLSISVDLPRIAGHCIAILQTRLILGLSLAKGLLCKLLGPDLECCIPQARVPHYPEQAGSESSATHSLGPPVSAGAGTFAATGLVCGSEVSCQNF